MFNIITTLITMATAFSIKPATAIAANELITEDGNTWAIVDNNLETGREYTILFDTQSNDNIYDDIILRVY